MTISKIMLNEHEFTTPTRLCGADGKLNRQAIGWSRHPLHACNLAESLQRKKKWNYWAITNDELLFSATIADVERAQVAGAYFVDRRKRSCIETGYVARSGSVIMPEGITGDIALGDTSMSVALTDEGSGTRIRVHAADFGGIELDADIVVERPPGHETLNVVIPWTDVQFQFTSKQNTLPASGYVQVGSERHELGQAAFGCLDYGRGVWPEHTLWNWGSASGFQGGHLVGLNLGGRWTDGTGMTENGLCVDGRLTKISEDLIFEYDRAATLKPWAVRSAVTNRIDLKFVPEFERVSTSGRRESYFVAARQVFGTYSGRVTPDSGEVIELRDMFGWIEDHEARW